MTKVLQPVKKMRKKKNEVLTANTSIYTLNFCICCFIIQVCKCP